MGYLRDRLIGTIHKEDCCCGDCNCEHEHNHQEEHLSEEEIEQIINEKYSEKDEKTKKFIRRSLKIHGLKYDYSKTIYIRSKDKVTMTCPIVGHGDFSIFPHDHLRTNRDCGCPTCGKIRTMMKRRDTQDEFIEKSKKLYPERLDYSKVNYINSRTKVILICKKHGTEFKIFPSSHLKGNFGCPNCVSELLSEERKKHKGEKMVYWDYSRFEAAGKEKFNDKFDYSKAKDEFTGFLTPVTIICPEHGEFKQSPRNHLASTTGCPFCGHDMMVKNKSFATEDFISIAEQKFPGKFDYSKVNYTKAKDKVIIRCIKHDIEFLITPDDFFNGVHGGCPECAKEGTGMSRKYTILELQKEIDLIYGDGVYIIPDQIYKDTGTEISVFDIEWNETFMIRPSYLLCGRGNPNHRSTIPRGELLVRKWCDDNDIKFNSLTKVTGDGITGRNESGYVIVDFIIDYENTKIFIEYNGEQHYKRVPFFHKTLEEFEKQLRRDEELRNYCTNNNIKLIEIPYVITDVSDFLTKTIIENIDPHALINYESLYVLDNDNST